jgi:butyryl-CoA dehydrogenase
VDLSLSEGDLAIQTRARDAAVEIVAPHARRSDEVGEFRRETIAALASRGFLGLPLPVRFGGEGATHLQMSLVYEEMGRVDSSVRGFLSVQVGLVSQAILQWGSSEQTSQWLPRLASGAAIGCYALTEPEAGSDAGSITTTAVRDGSGWRLTGIKHWITNGGIADLAIVFARTGGQGRRGITAFLVDTTSDGFRHERMAGKELGHRGSDHAIVTLDGVLAPSDAVLGEEGQGFRVAMAALDHGRLGVAAGAVGVLQACLDASVAFGQTRRQFGTRIGEFEMVQSSIADMAAECEAARLLVRQAAWLRDAGKPNTHAVSIAKLFATEAAMRAADCAVLLHGARGYSNEYPVERFYRDIKGLQIYEGTSHIQRIIIARALIGRESAK